MTESQKTRAKHPCTKCQSGYLECISGVLLSLQCCKHCDHPSRWKDNPPYTTEEYAEMGVKV